MKGDTVASCGSSGMMNLWNIRKSIPILSIDAGPHPANQVTFDHSDKLNTLGVYKGLADEDGQWLLDTTLCVHDKVYDSPSKEFWKMHHWGLFLPCCWGGRDIEAVVSGVIVSLASSDGCIKVLRLEAAHLPSLRGRGSQVRSVLFTHKAEQLLSGAADDTVRLWT